MKVSSLFLGLQPTENYKNICLNHSQFLLVKDEIDIFILQWIFPLLFLLGVMGNLLNLLVLLSKKMRRSTANWILSSMAFADLFYFLVLAFRFLASFQVMAENPWYYQFYKGEKHHLLALANWFSAASIWFVLAVTVERLIAIRFPLWAQFNLRKRQIFLGIISIFIFTFLLTFHYHMAFVKHFILCNDTQIYITNAHITNPMVEDIYSHLTKLYYKLSTLLNIVLVVIGPAVVMLGLSISLITSLKKQMAYFSCERFMEDPEYQRFRAREQRVTVMVAFIVTSFVITTFPSAMLNIWFLAWNMQKHQMPDVYFTLVHVSNCLVAVGKVLNFFLFCLSSQHFREALFVVVFPEKIRVSFGFQEHSRTRTQEALLMKQLKGTPKLNEKSDIEMEIVHWV